jgi:hypothetical protein
MESQRLKDDIISRISDINDIHLLETIRSLIDSVTVAGSIILTPEQLNEIASSRKDIDKGSFIENKILNREVKTWLEVR